ncbi:MAG: hypothetical protein ACK4WK_11735 [Anaerolineae bacterium]
MVRVSTREAVIQELEGLAEEQIPEVLDFIRFLKSQPEKPYPAVDRWQTAGPDPLQVLAELDRIREEMEARYGVYPGDPVREAREMRERQLEEAWGPSS